MSESRPTLASAGGEGADADGGGKRQVKNNAEKCSTYKGIKQFCLFIQMGQPQGNT